MSNNGLNPNCGNVQARFTHIYAVGLSPTLAVKAMVLAVVETADILLAVVSALLGGWIGATIADLRARKNAALALAFEFHREISESTMIEHRTQAQRILMYNKDQSRAELIQSSPDRVRSAWIVEAFYERLELALANHQMDRSVAGPLFGELFVFFYANFFSQGLDLINNRSGTMDRLAAILKSTVADSQWHEWERLAKRSVVTTEGDG